MRDIDDTNPPKTESERLAELIAELTARVSKLEKQVARLEQRKVANENNQDDPEWY